MTAKPWFCALAGCALCASSVREARGDVLGEDELEPGPHSILVSDIGIGVTLGGGITGFSGRTLRASTSQLGGTWGLRVAFGTHTPLCVEAAYVGSAMQIESQLDRETSTLIGTTFETDLRVNLLPHYITDPYVFAGVGVQRYIVDEPGFNLMTTGIANRSDVLEIPLGGGIAYRDGGFVADVRGTFRAVRDPDLVLEQPELARVQGGQKFAPMHSWEAALAVGYEF